MPVCPPHLGTLRHGLTPGVFQDVLGHLGGLSTPGLTREEDDLMAAHSFGDLFPATQMTSLAHGTGHPLGRACCKHFPGITTSP